jgi:hypothetical protein
MGMRRSTPEETRRSLARLLGGGHVAVARRQDGKIGFVVPPPPVEPDLAADRDEADRDEAGGTPTTD